MLKSFKSIIFRSLICTMTSTLGQVYTLLAKVKLLAWRQGQNTDIIQMKRWHLALCYDWNYESQSHRNSGVVFNLAWQSWGSARLGDKMYDLCLHADEHRGSSGYSHAERRLRRRQARAMMSPSLAHKLWLTLWSLEGEEMEWNEKAPSLCCGMPLGEKMRGEMVMVGEGGADASSNTSAWAKGTRPQPTTAARGALIYVTAAIWGGGVRFDQQPRTNT